MNYPASSSGVSNWKNISLLVASDGELTLIPTPLIPSLQVGRGRPKVGVGTIKITENIMERPSWLQQEKIKVSLDARPILASGQHPLERVIQESSALMPGEIYEIITPFPPMPMIEKLTALGFVSFSENSPDGLFHSYFLRK